MACWLLGLGPALEAAALAAVLDAWLVEPVLGWLLRWKWSWWSHCLGRWWVQSQASILVCQGGSAAEISIAVGCWGSAAKILELTLDVWPFAPQVGPVLAVDLLGLGALDCSLGTSTVGSCVLGLLYRYVCVADVAFKKIFSC